MFYSWHAQFSTGRPWKSSQVGQQGSLKGGPFGIAALAIWFFSSKGRNARRHKETTQGLPAMLSRSKARAMVKLSTLAGLSDSQVAQSADNSVLGGGGGEGLPFKAKVGFAFQSAALPLGWAGCWQPCAGTSTCLLYCFWAPYRSLVETRQRYKRRGVDRCWQEGAAAWFSYSSQGGWLRQQQDPEAGSLSCSREVGSHRGSQQLRETLPFGQAVVVWAGGGRGEGCWMWPRGAHPSPCPNWSSSKPLFTCKRLCLQGGTTSLGPLRAGALGFVSRSRTFLAWVERTWNPWTDLVWAQGSRRAVWLWGGHAEAEL